MSALGTVRDAFSKLRLDEAARFCALMVECRRGQGRTGEAKRLFSFLPRGLKHPVYGRAATSDVLVFRQIYVNDEYAGLPDIGPVRNVVDCGANVGYASTYFLNRYPEARVLAVEPDLDNFAMLRRNIAPYGDRVTAVQAGIWSHETDLAVRRSDPEKGYWSFTVEECGPGEPADVRAIDIASLLARHDMPTIDVLKIDIEGSEKVIFARSYESWIRRCRLLVIELHGDECKAVVEGALSGRDYESSRHGELTVYRFNDV